MADRDPAIRLRDKLLLVLSAASIASDWVEDEVDARVPVPHSRQRSRWKAQWDPPPPSAGHRAA
jgi:hypothetical protein